jgi:hypothetical protein
MIMLPIMLFMIITKQYNYRFYIWALVANDIIHLIIDDMKCNEELISYRTDQYIHMIQILITWLVYYLIMVL